jgi:cytochrome c oxidase subunit 2
MARDAQGGGRGVSIWDFPLLPDRASTTAASVDLLFWSMVALCGAVLLLVVMLLVWFMIHYRAGSKADRTRKIKKSWHLEIVWTAIPLALFILIFFWAAHVYLRMYDPPAGGMQVQVIAKQWMWRFRHPNGIEELAELHVPEGTPIKLLMTSEDVIHSFFVPAFRTKQDVLPGRYTTLWFQATKVGSFQIFCTQYCGTDHANMTGKVIVLSQADYQKWEAGYTSGATRLKPQSLAGAGRQLFHDKGCVSCHAADSPIKAPNLEGIYGTTERLEGGGSVVVDENYIRESILDPSAKVVEGLQPIMPSFRGQLSNEQLLDLVAYIKSLQYSERHP